MGTTDSEWAFCWLLAQLRRRFTSAPEWPELAPVLAEIDYLHRLNPEQRRAVEPELLATIERVQLTRTDAMRRRFRFTRTQAKLAEMLCEGMRPTHAAEALGVKISTVRTHVGQMYEKTGTHTQAQRQCA